MAFPQRHISSLKTLSMDYVMKSLGRYLTSDYETLVNLPYTLKTVMLKKFTSSSHSWANLSFHRALSAIIHPREQLLDLSLTTVDDDILELLQNCHNLRNVRLSTNENKVLTSQALTKFLSPLKNLHIFEVACCEGVDDDVLRTISKSCTKLAGLAVNGCLNISDEGLAEIANLENFQWLNLSSTLVTDKGIEKVVTGPSGPKFKEFRIANCKNITGSIVHLLVENCRNLQVLVFYNLTPEAVERQLSSLPERNLKNLKQITWTLQW